MFRRLLLLCWLLAWAQTSTAAPLSDPTRPYSAPSASAKPRPPRPLDLESTLFAEGRALARINGQLLRRGDSIRGYRLTEIGVDYVRLQKRGRQKVLRLLRRPVKRPTQSLDPSW